MSFGAPIFVDNDRIDPRCAQKVLSLFDPKMIESIVNALYQPPHDGPPTMDIDVTLSCRGFFSGRLPEVLFDIRFTFYGWCHANDTSIVTDDTTAYEELLSDPSSYALRVYVDGVNGVYSDGYFIYIDGHTQTFQAAQEYEGLIDDEERILFTLKRTFPTREHAGPIISSFLKRIIPLIVPNIFIKNYDDQPPIARCLDLEVVNMASVVAPFHQ